MGFGNVRSKINCTFRPQKFCGILSTCLKRLSGIYDYKTNLIAFKIRLDFKIILILKYLPVDNKSQYYSDKTCEMSSMKFIILFIFNLRLIQEQKKEHEALSLKPSMVHNMTWDKYFNFDEVKLMNRFSWYEINYSVALFVFVFFVNIKGPSYSP